MAIYFLVLALGVGSTFLARRSGSALLRRIFHSIAFLSLVLLAALRDRSVGTDTSNYVYSFEHTRTLADVFLLVDKTGEFGFWILMWGLHFLSDQYFICLLAIAVIVVGSFQQSILRYSVEPVNAMFVFIAMGAYTFFFNGARQGMACAIFAVAAGPLVRRQLAYYITWILIAFLFHKTAIVLLPAYVIANTRGNFKNIVLMVTVGVAVLLFYDKVLAVATNFDPRYLESGARGEGDGGYYVTGFDVVLGVFFVAIRKLIRTDSDQYGQFLNLYLVGVMIELASRILRTDPSGMQRLSMYFTIFVLFLWPIAFRNLPRRWVLSARFFFVLGYLAYFTLTTQRFSDLIPYKLNPFFGIW